MVSPARERVASGPSGTQATDRVPNPHQKTLEESDRDPILQVGSYAMEMLSMSRVQARNTLIVGMCLDLIWKPVLTATDERITTGKEVSSPTVST